MLGGLVVLAWYGAIKLAAIAADASDLQHRLKRVHPLPLFDQKENAEAAQLHLP